MMDDKQKAVLFLSQPMATLMDVMRVAYHIRKKQCRIRKVKSINLNLDDQSKTFYQKHYSHTD
jgi:hypothetical protein